MKLAFTTYEILKDKISQKYFGESVLFICIGVFSALLCTAYAKLFSLIEQFSGNLFEHNPYIVFLMAPLGLILSFLLVRWISPGASGSGIPQVMACVEHAGLAKKLLRKSVIIIKMVSSLLAVFVGAAIGREGPSLQISASMAYNLGKVFKRINIQPSPEQILVAGAASGLAAAFNTPIGGIVYAVEELSKEHIRKFKDILLLAVVLSGLTAQAILGNYLYLGSPSIPKHSGFSLYCGIALLGLLCGMLGSLFSKLLTALIQWRSQKGISTQLMIIFFAGLILACGFYFLGNASLFSGKEVINQALLTDQAVGLPTALSRFFGPLVSSMTGVAGGIFAPSLSAGAGIGSFTASLFEPEMKIFFTLAGMVGFLNGVTHTPITSFILVLEMTDRHSVVIPMMTAAVFSSIGARLLAKKSFYELSVDKILETELPVSKNESNTLS